MSLPEVAIVITAVGSVVTALGGLALALGVMIPNLRISRAAAEEITKTHRIVNSQRSKMLRYERRLRRYQRSLEAALHAAGAEIPKEVHEDDDQGRISEGRDAKWPGHG